MRISRLVKHHAFTMKYRRPTGAHAPHAIAAGAVLLALASLTACSRSGGDETSAAKPAQAAPIPVAVAAAAERRVERSVDFVGTLHANAEAEVASEVDGQLMALSADLGDAVKKGELLATIDGSALEAQLREADAVLAKAEADEQRAQRLRSEKVMSAQEFDQLASALRVARARREVLAIQVDRTRIRAPFAGRIAKREVDVGSYVRPGTKLFVLVSDDPLRLRGEVPERFAAEVQIGQEVRANVAAYSDTELHGRLTRMSGAVDPESRALAVEAEIPNPDGRLRPGFFTKARVVVREDARAVVVPVDAVSTFAGVARVFVVDDGGAVHTREVATGERMGSSIEIARGLEPGERVAVSSLARLTEGTKITARETKGEVTAAAGHLDATTPGDAAADRDEDAAEAREAKPRAETKS